MCLHRSPFNYDGRYNSSMVEDLDAVFPAHIKTYKGKAFYEVPLMNMLCGGVPISKKFTKDEINKIQSDISKSIRSRVPDTTRTALAPEVVEVPIDLYYKIIGYLDSHCDGYNSECIKNELKKCIE